MLRVVIADDSYLIREGLRQILGFDAGIQIVGLYNDAPSLLAAIDRDAPDVVMTDIRMPPTQTDEGMQIAAQLRNTHPSIGVVVLSQHESVYYAAELLQSGSAGRGYLLKDRIHDLDHIISTIKAVAQGECRVDARLVDHLVSCRRGQQPTVLESLTPRQCEILKDMAEGKSNLAITEERGLTQRAVEKHVRNLRPARSGKRRNHQPPRARHTALSGTARPMNGAWRNRLLLAAPGLVLAAVVITVALESHAGDRLVNAILGGLGLVLIWSVAVAVHSTLSRPICSGRAPPSSFPCRACGSSSIRACWPRCRARSWSG